MLPGFEPSLLSEHSLATYWCTHLLEGVLGTGLVWRLKSGEGALWRFQGIVWDKGGEVLKESSEGRFA